MKKLWFSYECDMIIVILGEQRKGEANLLIFVNQRKQVEIKQKESQ